MNYEDLTDIVEAAEEFGNLKKSDLIFSQIDSNHNIFIAPSPSSNEGTKAPKASKAPKSRDSMSDTRVNISDLQLLMRLLGQHIDQNKLQRILDRSRAKDDDIDFPEFLKELDSFISDPCTEQELRRAFRVFDPENRGKVTFQEMRRAVDKFSEEATIEVPELEELFAHMNIGKNQSFENIIIRNQKTSKFNNHGGVQARRDVKISSHAAMNSEITVEEFIRTMDVIF